MMASFFPLRSLAMPARLTWRPPLLWLLQLAGLGATIGVACWPFNWLDAAQANLLQRLLAFSGESWSWSFSRPASGAPELVQAFLRRW